MLLTEKCRELNISYYATKQYIKIHNCTETEAILHYRLDLYTNILGEIVGYEHLNETSLKKQCIIDAVGYNTARNFKAKYRCSVSEAIELTKKLEDSREVISKHRDICKDNGVDYDIFMKWCYKRNTRFSEENLHMYIESVIKAKEKRKLAKYLEKKYNCKYHSVREYAKKT